MNITGNVDTNSFSDTAYRGVNSTLLEMSTLMTLCEDPAQQGECRGFNSGAHWQVS